MWSLLLLVLASRPEPFTLDLHPAVRVDPKRCGVTKAIPVNFRGAGRPFIVEERDCDSNPSGIESLLVVREGDRILLVDPAMRGERLELSQPVAAGGWREAILVAHDEGNGSPEYGVLAWSKGRLTLLEAPNLWRAARSRSSRLQSMWKVEVVGDVLRAQMWIYGKDDPHAAPSGGSFVADLAADAKRGTLRLLDLSKLRPTDQ